MPCAEVLELESIWQKRFERANFVQQGGLFAVPVSTHSHPMVVRQLRAKQAQAAQAILAHQRQCSVCNSGELVEPFVWPDSVAS